MKEERLSQTQRDPGLTFPMFLCILHSIHQGLHGAYFQATHPSRQNSPNPGGQVVMEASQPVQGQGWECGCPQLVPTCKLAAPSHSSSLCLSLTLSMSS